MAPGRALAQSNTDPPVASPSVVTGRDVGPDAAPNVYTDTGVLTVELTCHSLRQVGDDQAPDPHRLCFSPDYRTLYVVGTGRSGGNLFAVDVTPDNRCVN